MLPLMTCENVFRVLIIWRKNINYKNGLEDMFESLNLLRLNIGLKFLCMLDMNKPMGHQRRENFWISFSSNTGRIIFCLVSSGMPRS